MFSPARVSSSSRMRSIASSPPPAAIGSGSSPSPPLTCQPITAPVTPAAITSAPPGSNAPSARPPAWPASPNASLVTRSATASPPTCSRTVRHPHRAGAPRASRRQDHHDLHPRPQSRRPRRAQPARCRLISGSKTQPLGAASFHFVVDDDQTSVNFCVTSRHIIPITSTVNSSRIARMNR